MYKLLIIFLLGAVTLNAQTPQIPMSDKTEYNWKRGAACFGLGLLNGTINGVHETLNYHYERFQERHPNANPQYWNPQQSWTNKYKNGDAQQGPKYFGSTTFLVLTTDGIHVINTLQRVSMPPLGIIIVFGDKKPWWHYAINAVAGYVGYITAFHLTYNVYYKE